MPLSFSIIITCYNKSAFIAQAIESAIEQTYPHKEVIVVDDGSKDHSLVVIERFGDRVTVVAKPNGGQTSAGNAGFAKSAGDVVLFLDGDDFLLPDTLERLGAIWSDGMAKAHFPLQVTDSAGQFIEGKMLPPYLPLARGDMRATMQQFGFYPTPPASGNAFARAVLADIMPLDAAFPILDTPLIGLAALYGEIGALDTAGGCWRRSDGNFSSGGLRQLVEKVRNDRYYTALVNGHERAKALGAPFPARWPQHMKDRFILGRFAMGLAANESLFALLRDYCACLLTWPEYRPVQRLKFLIWAVGIYLLPLAAIRRLPGILGPSVNVSGAD